MTTPLFNDVLLAASFFNAEGGARETGPPQKGGSSMSGGGRGAAREMSWSRGHRQASDYNISGSQKKNEANLFPLPTKKKKWKREEKKLNRMIV